ncbi:hypothetical protein SK128_024115 [Halocaridina rubra]|uniref:Uncharacterized protein n=1 Tax=Halocaridina rubra TaxID=373956 RepID=A0AAN8WZW3_HALRR
MRWVFSVMLSIFVGCQAYPVKNELASIELWPSLNETNLNDDFTEKYPIDDWINEYPWILNTSSDINFNIPPYYIPENEDIDAPTYTTTYTTTFVPLGGITLILVVLLRVRLCCVLASLGQRARTITIIRRVSANASSSDEFVNVATSPSPSPVDDPPPSYAEIGKEIPPPAYTEYNEADRDANSVTTNDTTISEEVTGNLDNGGLEASKTRLPDAAFTNVRSQFAFKRFENDDE